MPDILRDKELKGIEFETNNCNLVINWFNRAPVKPV